MREKERYERVRGTDSMKRFLQGILCWILICQCFMMKVYAAPAWPADTSVEAESGIVVDADSGAVLFSKNIDETYPPASITKLLTALVVLENSKLDETVTFTESAMNNVEPDSGNKYNLTAGDSMSVEDSLYLLLLQSCNQAGNALAEHVAESNDAFVAMMNQKVADLGCTGSHFDNPSGLNGDTQYVTARDMALIARAAFANPQLLEISSALKHTIPGTINNPEPFTIYTEHRMLKVEETPYYYEPAKAGKTGYLLKAGNTLVTYAEQDGKKLISVILKGSPGQYFLDGRALLQFGFANFDNYNVAEQETGYVTGETLVEIGGKSYQPSDLEIDSAGTVTVPKGAAFTDLERELVTDFPDEHPERSVAFIQYTYEGRKAGGSGGAYLKVKEEAVVAPSTEAESTPETVPEEKKEDEKGKFPIIPVVIVVFVIVASLMGGGAYLTFARKREEEARARRREERRKRLAEEGVSEEEFNRLLQERLEGKNRKRD